MTVGAERKREIALRDERIASAYASGRLQSEIAAAEGISAGMVSLSLKKTGGRLSPEEAFHRMVSAGRTPEARAKAAISISKPVEERLFAKVTKGDAPDDCWGWSGAVDGNGYAQIRRDGRAQSASHLSLLMDGRARPAGKYALHTCDNPLCTNPRHLWWGTQKENIQDALQKGRLNLSGLALGLPARLAKCKI